MALSQGMAKLREMACEGKGLARLAFGLLLDIVDCIFISMAEFGCNISSA